jgi:hypothetical protein
MRDDILQQLMDRWERDEVFRAGLRRDPRATIKDAGFDLKDEEWAAVEGFDWSQTDAQLEARVSRSAPPGGGC